MNRSLIGLVAYSVLTGCTPIYTADRPAEYYAQPAATGAVEASLFSSDSAVLTDADIARILTYRYTPPKLSRVAILPFGWSAWSGWSEEMALSTEEVNSKVIATLRASPQVYDASFLPSILVPEKRNAVYLREAAARYQADLLLVFRSACRSFEKYRLFASDETRAFCAVEAIVLDTRTGLVPFVASSTRNYDAKKTEGDLTFQETVLRAQLTAIAAALGEVSTAVVSFLAPKRDAGQ